ncbi:MAG TPA: glycosyltransferase family 2 protein [Bryobacteraceae bacterium]|nr:glycosyltransferase family 2 protein [Bryobacteraceae bacterium]
MSDRPADATSGVTVVIPNWNRRDLLIALLNRLRAQTYPIIEVLVVDNGSEDGSPEAARCAGARVIELGRNMGFSGAVNRGIEETQTDLVAIVNNDVEPEPDWLEQLATAIEQPRVAFAAGKLRSTASPDSLDGTYDAICRGACAWRAGHGSKDGPLWDRQRTIRFVPFTATLFRTDLFRKIGGLDERFRSYLEDVDFCLRSARQGYRGLYVPRAVARHQGSATLGRWNREVVRLIARNQVLLLAKHYPLRYLFRYGWPIFVAQALWGTLAVAHGQPWAFVRGKFEGLALIPGVRREIRRSGGWPKGLSRILEESETEIYRIQRRTGFDLYWRLYFALTCLS